MISFSSRYQYFKLLLAAVIVFSNSVNANSKEQALNSKLSNSNKTLLSQLTINQGKGHFSQKKYFKFLSQPIISEGRFIVKDESVLWQTESPVFSQLLVKPNAIFKRLSIKENYQLLVENAQLSSVLKAIFNGQISMQNWQLLDAENQLQSCINLKPKSEQLQQVFKLATLCLLKDNRRQIVLVDTQDNKTEILMQLSHTPLNEKDIDSLKREQK